jgi:hypothetical protein
LLVAAAFISVIDEPSRFERASRVSSYLGLCPRENTTGYRQQLGRITKHGNSYARWMLVQAAWAVVRSNDMTDPLVRWARKLKQRRGGMRTAVAVARRLSRILWALWRHGGVYDPASLAQASARGRADQAQQAQDEEQQLQHAVKIAQTRKRAEQKLGKKHRNLQRQLERATASL